MELQAISCCIQALNRPVLFWNEGLDFFFPFANEAHGNGLDTAGTEALANLLPKERTQLVAYNTVQNAAGLLGIDLLQINRLRRFNPCKDSLFRDFVEHDAARCMWVNFQQMCQMPGNSFPFTVRVSCQIDIL